jgi:hypothetical protein
VSIEGRTTEPSNSNKGPSDGRRDSSIEGSIPSQSQRHQVLQRLTNLRPVKTWLKLLSIVHSRPSPHLSASRLVIVQPHLDARLQHREWQPVTMSAEAPGPCRRRDSDLIGLPAPITTASDQNAHEQTPGYARGMPPRAAWGKVAANSSARCGFGNWAAKGGRRSNAHPRAVCQRIFERTRSTPVKGLPRAVERFARAEALAKLVRAFVREITDSSRSRDNRTQWYRGNERSAGGFRIDWRVRETAGGSHFMFGAQTRSERAIPELLIFNDIQLPTESHGFQ